MQEQGNARAEEEMTKKTYLERITINSTYALIRPFLTPLQEGEVTIESVTIGRRGGNGRGVREGKVVDIPGADSLQSIATTQRINLLQCLKTGVRELKGGRKGTLEKANLDSRNDVKRGGRSK